MGELTIVICTYNRCQTLRLCLTSLIKQTDREFDVLLIDGGSSDGTNKVIATLQKRLKIKTLVDTTPHLAYIRDIGWRNTSSEIVAWIDDDVVVHPEWCAAIKQACKRPSSGGVTGPTVIPQYLLNNRMVFLFHTTHNPLLKLLGKFYFKLFMQGEKYTIGKIYPSGAWSPGSNFSSALELKRPILVDYLEACNFAVRRSVLAEVGGYDLKYKGISEWCEVDLAFRIRKKGYQLIFDPKIAVEHHVSTAGVFTRRINSFTRMYNLLRFYICSYYPKTITGILQFFLYLNFFNLYWLYLMLRQDSRVIKGS